MIDAVAAVLGVLWAGGLIACSPLAGILDGFEIVQGCLAGGLVSMGLFCYGRRFARLRPWTLLLLVPISVPVIAWSWCTVGALLGLVRFWDLNFWALGAGYHCMKALMEALGWWALASVLLVGQHFLLDQLDRRWARHPTPD